MAARTLDQIFIVLRRDDVCIEGSNRADAKAFEEQCDHGPPRRPWGFLLIVTPRRALSGTYSAIAFVAFVPLQNVRSCFFFYLKGQRAIRAKHHHATTAVAQPIYRHR